MTEQTTTAFQFFKKMPFEDAFEKKELPSLKNVSVSQFLAIFF
ncbi:MAG: hypothetical protein Q8908_00835 [Bacteroidota bacterium]|nr:hypothetical protein [Bacteroidota bacterium]